MNFSILISLSCICSATVSYLTIGPAISCGNKAIYNIDEDEFFYGAKKFIELGASILGGCCGTTPQYINKISDNISILEKIRLKNSLLK